MYSMPVRRFVRGQVGLIVLTALCVCLAQLGCGRSKCDAPPAGRLQVSEEQKSVGAQASGNKLEETLDKCSDENTQFEDALSTNRFRAAGVGQDTWATKEVGGKKAYLKRTSGEKSFHLNTDGVWMDDSCSSAQGGDGVIAVKYLSDEYYNLLKAKPAMEGYFGVGDKVMFAVDGKTYRIDRSGSK